MVPFLSSKLIYELQIKNNNFSIDHQKHKKFMTKISALFLLPLVWMILVPSMAYFGKLEISVVIIAANVYQLLHSLVYVFQFSCAALAVKTRFKLLNAYLKG